MGVGREVEIGVDIEALQRESKTRGGQHSGHFDGLIATQDCRGRDPGISCPYKRFQPKSDFLSPSASSGVPRESTISCHASSQALGTCPSGVYHLLPCFLASTRDMPLGSLPSAAMPLRKRSAECSEARARYSGQKPLVAYPDTHYQRLSRPLPRAASGGAPFS